jgi:hypothetical protein
MTDDGWGPGNGGVYEHGILTYAMGEYFTSPVTNACSNS